ncbi:MAG: chemotaxis protein CheW [Bdellovibrionales bacterium]|nr:chemotaxis protein CheW [Bdellovibrionales bacterium]
MGNKEKYICFKLGDELFASPLSKVVEIYQLQDLEPIKKGVSIFLGNFNAGALEIPLLDLAKIVGRKNKTTQHEESCIVIFDLSDGPWGALVENLEGIITFDSSDIQGYSEPDSPIYGKAMGVKNTYKLINPEKMVNKIDRLRWSSNKYQTAS